MIKVDAESRNLIEPPVKNVQDAMSSDYDGLSVTDFGDAPISKKTDISYGAAQSHFVIQQRQRLEIAEKIAEDWGGKPQASICVAILDYLLNNNTADSAHITYGFLQESVKESEQAASEDRELWIAIQYLCGERVHLLDAKFELVDNGVSFPISNSLLNDARKTGKLAHPKNSKLISDFEDKVFIYFQPSSLVQNASV
jgi:hypothetical protein